MDKIPFNIYDFFSYLFAGFWLLIGIDFVFNLHLLLGRELPPAHVAFWIIASYVVGHINSHWSAWLLEEKSLRLLGKPETLLFGEGGKRFFRHYRKSLPTRTAKLIEEKYTRMHGGGGTDLDRFIFCFNLVKEQCPQALIRLSQFLNLYGFTRNLCFATLLVTIGILGKAVLYPRSLFFYSRSSRDSRHLHTVSAISQILSIVLGRSVHRLSRKCEGSATCPRGTGCYWQIKIDRRNQSRRSEYRFDRCPKR